LHRSPSQSSIIFEDIFPEAHIINAQWFSLCPYSCFITLLLDMYHKRAEYKTDESPHGYISWLNNCILLLHQDNVSKPRVKHWRAFCYPATISSRIFLIDKLGLSFQFIEGNTIVSIDYKMTRLFILFWLKHMDIYTSLCCLTIVNLFILTFACFLFHDWKCLTVWQQTK
jgi:hypothetical protein